MPGVHAGPSQLFSHLDTLEIRIILNAGVRGKFGEWYGLNPLTFYNWTSAYVESDQRAAYVRRRRRLSLLPGSLRQSSLLPGSNPDDGQKVGK